MKLPYLQYQKSKSTQQIMQFSGIRYGEGGAAGEFSDTRNLSSRLYPALCQREPREEVAGYSGVSSIFGKGKLCAVEGTNFLYDGEVVGHVERGEKQIVSINTKIVIWPDKVYYDTNLKKFGTLGEKLTIEANKAIFTGKTLTVSGAGKSLEELFAENQAIEISGSSIEENNKSIIIREVGEDTLTFYDDSFTEGTSSSAVTLERKIPELKVICSSDNRVWGADDTTLWACALGDPLTWYNYDGLSTDSYAVAVGTDGPFTGCVSYGSNILFWKSNVLHKVLGNMPSQYQVYTYTVQGVQIGCEKSMQIINETLYYKGVDGIYAYAGGTPYLISSNFGTKRYGNAVAGNDGQRYYISMQDLDTKEWGMWVYDTTRGIWLQEDETHAVDFTLLDDEMLFLSSDGKVYRTGLPEEEGSELFDWSATLYPIDESVSNKKGYSKLFIRLEMDPWSYVKAEIKEDLNQWRQVGVIHGSRVRTKCITMVPWRCDTFQVRLSGRGRCIVKSLVREFDVGSEY